MTLYRVTTERSEQDNVPMLERKQPDARAVEAFTENLRRAGMLDENGKVKPDGSTAPQGQTPTGS